MSDDGPDLGSPISYLVLRQGTPVFAAGREQVGTVEKALYVEQEDVFDGIVIRTDQGLRFVDADQVEGIYERGVVTNVTPEQAGQLPAPEGGAPVYRVDPAEATGKSLRDRLRRLFGRGGWQRRPS
ncbi:MAG: hypothetical protein ACM3QU_08615 [Verrucomicrobiota bacterium]